MSRVWLYPRCVSFLEPLCLYQIQQFNLRAVVFSAAKMHFGPASCRERHLVTNKAVLSWKELLGVVRGEHLGKGCWEREHGMGKGVQGSRAEPL